MYGRRLLIYGPCWPEYLFFVYCYLVRGSTQIFTGDAASNRPTPTVANTQHMSSNDQYNFEAVPFNYLDSPNTTSSATYKLQARTAGATHVSMHNGTGTTVMLMEIKG